MKYIYDAVVWLAVVVLIAAAIYTTTPSKPNHPDPDCLECQRAWAMPRNPVTAAGVEANIREWKGQDASN